MTLEEAKPRIDAMSYESMLALWRSAPVGHPMFKDDVGDYFEKVMREKRETVGNDAAVAASKSVGFKN